MCVHADSVRTIAGWDCLAPLRVHQMDVAGGVVNHQQVHPCIELDPFYDNAGTSQGEAHVGAIMYAEDIDGLLMYPGFIRSHRKLYFPCTEAVGPISPFVARTQGYKVAAGGAGSARGGPERLVARMTEINCFADIAHDGGLPAITFCGEVLLSPGAAKTASQPSVVILSSGQHRTPFVFNVLVSL